MPAFPSPVPLEPSWLSHHLTCHVTSDPSQPLAPIWTLYDHLWAPDIPTMHPQSMHDAWPVSLGLHGYLLDTCIGHPSPFPI